MVTAATFSTKGNLIVCGTQDGEIGIRDMAASSSIVVSFPDRAPIVSVAISPDESLIAAASRSGIVTLYSHAGKRLLVLSMLDETENWIAYTDDRLFDGTPNAMDEISWKLNDAPLRPSLPLQQFFGDFFWPSLMSEIYRGAEPKPPIDPLIAFQIPGLRLQVANKQLKFRKERKQVVACFRETPSIAVQEAPGEKAIAYQDPSGYEVNPSDKNCQFRKVIDLYGQDPDQLLQSINSWTDQPARNPIKGTVSDVVSSDLFVQTIAIGHYPEGSASSTGRCNTI
jgi:WD40 repeat protein